MPNYSFYKKREHLSLKQRLSFRNCLKGQLAMRHWERINWNTWGGANSWHRRPHQFHNFF